jgi:carbonic anhydrase/SulP family sulfate permease
VELVFDLGIGDVFSVRMAGNIASEKVIGSLEFACAVAGAKLIVVMGHTKCGAVLAALNDYLNDTSVRDKYGCAHLGQIIDDIQQVAKKIIPHKNDAIRDGEEWLGQMLTGNVIETIEKIKSSSPTLKSLLIQKQIAMVGCIYDVTTGAIKLIDDQSYGSHSSGYYENAAKELCQ